MIQSSSAEGAALSVEISLTSSTGIQLDNAWQEGYAGFRVSRSQEKAVIEYICNQQAHHKRRSFEEEILELVRAHGIETIRGMYWIECRAFCAP